MFEYIKQIILDGKLTMPSIVELQHQCGDEVYYQIEHMFTAMWHAYLLRGTKGTISLPYWAQRINDPKHMNIALKVLSDAGWITVSTRPNNNWSEAYINTDKLLIYVSQSQLDYVRTIHKFTASTLKLIEVDDSCASLTKTRDGIADTGLVRNGFMKAGKTEFQFDTVAMVENHKLVVTQINKGIEKTIKQYPHIADDHANFREVATEIVDSYIHSAHSKYNSGNGSSDTRGRDIAGYLSKIGNPVGYKVMRALLLIPIANRFKATPKGLRANYLFIAELNGFTTGSTEDKVNFGRECYYTKSQCDDEVDNLWLNRVYADIKLAIGIIPNIKAKIWLSYLNGSTWHKVRANNKLTSVINAEEHYLTSGSFKWTCPIEIDMSASVIGFIGLLLSHRPFMNRCNITAGNLTDAWAHDVVTHRDQFKSIMRLIYGSNMTPQAMWSDMSIEYTDAQVEAFNHELKHGDLVLANKFKEFIINSCKMKSEMTLDNSVEQYKVSCNKQHNVGKVTTKYDIYDTSTGTIRRIHNTSITQIDDLDAFKRFTVTGLIHNQDSLVMDSAVEAVYDEYAWVLPIHDAMIVNPESAEYARESYANGTTNKYSLAWVHANRNQILGAYFTSIGIPASKLQEFKDTVLCHVDKFEGQLVVNPMVLK